MNKNVISLNETTGIVTNGDIKVVSTNGSNDDMNNILKKENKLEYVKERTNKLKKCKRNVNNHIKNKYWMTGVYMFLIGIQLAAAFTIKYSHPILWAVLIITGVIVTPIKCISDNIDAGRFYDLYKIRDEEIPKKIRESKAKERQIAQEISEMKEKIGYVETDLTTSHQYSFDVPMSKSETGGYYNTPNTNAKVLKLVDNHMINQTKDIKKRY